MDREVKLRIRPLEAGSMIALAVIVDGLQALLDLLIIGLFLNWIISIIAFMIYWWWFGQRNVSFTRSGSFLGLGLAIELIPLLNALPTWTLDVIILLGMTYAEDVAAAVSPEIADALVKVTSGNTMSTSRAANQQRSEQLRPQAPRSVYNRGESNESDRPTINDVKPKEKIPGIDDFDGNFSA